MSCTTECTGIEYSKQGSQTITQVVVGKPTKSVVLKMVEIISPPPPTHTHPHPHTPTHVVVSTACRPPLLYPSREVT